MQTPTYSWYSDISKVSKVFLMRAGRQSMSTQQKGSASSDSLVHVDRDLLIKTPAFISYSDTLPPKNSPGYAMETATALC